MICFSLSGSHAVLEIIFKLGFRLKKDFVGRLNPSIIKLKEFHAHIGISLRVILP